MNNRLQNIIDKIPTHGIGNNGTPPDKPEIRHVWECKQLYSVIECLIPSSSILDYGCGPKGTLQHTLFDYYKFKGWVDEHGANYYGLDLPTTIKPLSKKGVYLGYNTELDEILPKVDCMVMGSVFTHLDWEGITNILNKTLPYYKKGFQVGFTTFFGDNINLVNPDWYGQGTGTYHMSYIPKEKYQEYCDKYHLTLVHHDYTHKYGNLEHQFITIKKK